VGGVAIRSDTERTTLDCELYVAARSGNGHLSLELQKPVF
jgi:hypothetical protein